jgi:tripartite-type tricarboxylate transporter receptor subunit TctC
MAQDTYPSKPIRIIVPTVPGGGLDLTTRLIADKLGRVLEQTVIVENRPGADTVLGVRAVKDAEPDGYTLLTHAGQFLSTPLVKADAGYDPLVDFKGVGRMISYPMVIELAPEKPEQTFGDVIASAKANPGQLSFASGGVGSPSHMSVGSLLIQSGVEMTHVPYKGIGQALPDVAAGRTYIVADGYNSSRSYIEGGKLRPLVVTGSTRLADLPDVPTLQEEGFDFTYHIWLGMFAPANTPDAVVERLSKALHEVLNDPDLKARFESEGSTPIIETPAEFDAFMKADHEELVQVVKDLNLAP